MDVLDHLNERHNCGLCDRPIRFTDDFCSRCRQVLPAGADIDPEVIVEAELALLLAAS
jgi:predicted amidophosphoribosyltransferase